MHARSAPDRRKMPESKVSHRYSITSLTITETSSLKGRRGLGYPFCMDQTIHLWHREIRRLPVSRWRQGSLLG
jgi:hypothetical protein